MNTLTEHRSLNYHYFTDINGTTHGEYKRWYDCGPMHLHGFYIHGMKHGEFKGWYNNGDLCTHCIYVRDRRHDIPNIDILTDEDKFELCLKHGHMEFLP